MLNGRVTLLQPEKGYRTAIDPIFLAAAVPARSGDRVLEIGSGSGAASFCLAARVRNVQVTGLELQLDLVELANESACLNRLNDHVMFSQGDLLFPPKIISRVLFDHVMANPPHLLKGSVISSPDPQKEKAYVEGKAGLSDWINFALKMLRDGGTATFIHRYDRQDEVISSLAKGAGDIVIFPLWPKTPSRSAKRVIVQGRKGMKGSITLAKGVVLHDDKGKFTQQASKILRDASGLIL